MKKTIISMILLAQCFAMSAQDTLWVRYDNRFKRNESAPLTDADSIRVKTMQTYIYYHSTAVRTLTPTPGKSTMMLSNPGRYLLKPSTYSGTDYENQDATSGYNFAHSKESEHFVVFWDARYGSNPAKIQYPGDGNVANVDKVLEIAEKCWDMYAGELGFVKEGSSTTDKYKVQLYIPYQKE